MNVHSFLEKRAASRAQISKAQSLIKALRGKKDLSRVQMDALDRANMVIDRQSSGKEVAHNIGLLKDLSSGSRIGRSTARQELEKSLMRGKSIGKAKRLGKLTVPDKVTSGGVTITRGIKTVSPRVSNSGLTSQLQPTKKIEAAKQKARDTLLSIVPKKYKQNKDKDMSRIFRRL
jgi:hypothetical protein